VGDEEARRALRFATYHLIAATNPADEYVSIGARGLTGEAYRGHVFWDTEIYMLPFYVFTDPPAARSLLMYRYHTLAAARRKAKAHGYEGAMYAWESADTGDEVTPRTVVAPDGRLVTILTGEREQHITADVAYAVWQYWHATGDDAFMVAAGAEILVETARFWVSRAQFEHDGYAHIRQVIGPDEYHEMVDDNAYANTMAIFNLECAADVVAILERHQTSDWQRLFVRLGLTEKEPQSWRALAATLTTGFDPATQLIEQFAGYFRLEEVDVAAQRGQATPVDVWLGPERLRRSKAIKQADVVALSALLWEKWPVAVHDANFRHYEPRTAHGSSLSPALHALIAARLGDGPSRKPISARPQRSIWPTTWAMLPLAFIWPHLVVSGRLPCSAPPAYKRERMELASTHTCSLAGQRWLSRCNGADACCVCTSKPIPDRSRWLSRPATNSLSRSSRDQPVLREAVSVLSCEAANRDGALGRRSANAIGKNRAGSSRRLRPRDCGDAGGARAC
jgi:hypothetical protein